MKLQDCFLLIEKSDSVNKEDFCFAFANKFLEKSVNVALSEYAERESKWGFNLNAMTEIINRYANDSDVADSLCEEWIGLYLQSEKIHIQMNSIKGDLDKRIEGLTKQNDT